MVLTKRMIISSIFVLLAIVCFLFIQNLSKKEALVPDGAVDLDFPFKDGEFYVMQNGPDPLLNVHMSPGERYALDIAKTQDFWKMFGLKPSLESDPTFGIPVYSPCGGVVKSVGTGYPDMPIGKRDLSHPGNYVTISCNGIVVHLVHFKQNSIEVKFDDRVERGSLIGFAGNSGNTDIPHLHIAASRENDNGGNTPLPITFSGRYLKKGDYWPE